MKKTTATEKTTEYHELYAQAERCLALFTRKQLKKFLASRTRVCSPQSESEEVFPATPGGVK